MNGPLKNADALRRSQGLQIETKRNAKSLTPRLLKCDQYRFVRDGGKAVGRNRR